MGQHQKAPVERDQFVWPFLVLTAEDMMMKPLASSMPGSSLPGAMPVAVAYLAFQKR
jgi:hypothetical protein